MKRYIIPLVLGILLLPGLLAFTACSTTQTPQYPYSPGSMMGPGSVTGPGGMMGPGSVTGPGGMMGQGNMMGPGEPYRTGGQRITMDEAINIVENYINSSANSNLEVAEIMEFDYNFYVDFVEKDTGIHAFEALIDPYTGDMYPEPGPNMMWNAKYGMMSGMMWGSRSPSGPMTINETQAVKYGQAFIDGYLPGGKVEDPERFYGYYTLHVEKDGEIYGMLSVNGYTGQVWYHSWHGRFLGMEELDEH